MTEQTTPLKSEASVEWQFAYRNKKSEENGKFNYKTYKMIIGLSQSDMIS